ncbi:phosphonatase-like hydrolase [Tsukamurella sp. 8F]|uniref:phosphonatase-like hydrolase n=1 Tax=unclassified Tsukamurella TaxID=2633480 RepID=UPI0023B95073|nr:MULTISPECIES: phosphonatase-like hydrolase [unclassified Tsukamurella]MDF0529289.1 phosphonatase-like hydrolase [Tsukamurella sp. 8J]MDF0586874.1 phosphonatase-like hydrolase [Tsukamurella sp. 8F]
MISLVALDIAGTTVDDGGSVYDALRECVEETGASVAPVDLQTWMGADKVEAITHLLRIGGVESESAVVASCFARFRDLVKERYAAAPPVPVGGAVEAMVELRRRGVKVALTTGFSADVAGPLLEALGWSVGSAPDDTVDAVVTTDDVAAGRPAPYMIFHAMEATGVQDVREVLAAGDTVVDIRAGRASGGLSVGVLTGKADRATLEAEDHDYVLDAVADIPALAEIPR